MSYEWIEEKKPMLIYIADPMCSWCYGFAPEITQVSAQLPEYPLKLVMGGLRPHGTETLQQLGDFLQHHWEEVGKRSGQAFSFDILKNKDFIYDTEPACRAVVTMRHMAPELEFDFFKAVQVAFYHKNEDTHDPYTYKQLATSFSLDGDAYVEKFESEEVRYETKTDFQVAAEMGIRGFPSVVLSHADQFFLAANGYRTASDLLAVISRIREG